MLGTRDFGMAADSVLNYTQGHTPPTGNVDDIQSLRISVFMTSEQDGNTSFLEIMRDGGQFLSPLKVKALGIKSLWAQSS